jgi:hypothetical protein
MKVTEVDPGVDLAKPAVGYVRTPGRHISDLYGEMYRQMDPDRFDKRQVDGTPQPFNLVKLELGLTFEEMLEHALGESILGGRPGEFVTQHEADCEQVGVEIIPGVTCPCGAGVIYSPDWIFFDDDMLGEFKLTFYSSKGALDDPKFDKYKTQIMSYLYHLRMTRARLYIMFIRGDYKGANKGDPELRCWQLEFTPAELRRNWLALVKIGRKAGLL